jgi:hypothetical protein
LQLWGADVGNAYLEATTKEKVYIVGGPEFGSLEGHSLVIDCALYALSSTGLCWHERFSDVLRSMGFTPSKAEADIWMRENGGLYEYIAVNVDDLLIEARDPNSIVQTLQEKHIQVERCWFTYLPSWMQLLPRHGRYLMLWTKEVTLIRSWDSMRTCLVVNHVSIHHL